MAYARIIYKVTAERGIMSDPVFDDMTGGGPSSKFLTVRDTFAVAAMRGFMRVPQSDLYRPHAHAYIAHHSYAMADAMLKVRNESVEV